MVKIHIALSPLTRLNYIKKIKPKRKRGTKEKLKVRGKDGRFSLNKFLNYKINCLREPIQSPITDYEEMISKKI